MNMMRRVIVRRKKKQEQTMLSRATLTAFLATSALALGLDVAAVEEASSRDARQPCVCSHTRCAPVEPMIGTIGQRWSDVDQGDA